jgi:hypothetical protein
MSDFSSQNFKIGPCTVIFKGEVLGETTNSSVIKFNSKYHTFTNDQITGIPIIRQLQEINITFETEIFAVDKGLNMLLDSNGKITMDEINYMREPDYGELKLIPINPQDTTGYRFPRALLLRNASLNFNSSEDHSLKLQFEAVYDQNELMIETFTVNETDRINLDVSTPIDPAAFERAMTYYIADKLNMTVDTNIFRGTIPPNVDGCAVELVNYEFKDNSRSHEFFISFYCIDSSRDKVIENITALSDKFPVYGKLLSLEDSTTVNCKYIRKISCEFSKETADDGKIKSFGELLLKISI